MAHPQGNRRLVTLLALLAVLAVLIVVFKLGKMSGGTGRTLKSTSGKSGVRLPFAFLPLPLTFFSYSLLISIVLALWWSTNRYSELVSSHLPLSRLPEPRRVRPHHRIGYAEVPFTTLPLQLTCSRLCKRLNRFPSLRMVNFSRISPSPSSNLRLPPSQVRMISKDLKLLARMANQ